MQEILLIDSQNIWSFILTSYLPETEYNTTIAKSLDEAIVYCTQRNFDIVIYDIFEDIISHDMIEILTSKFRTPIPIIILVEANTPLLSNSYTTQIEKPIYASELHNAIIELVNNDDIQRVKE